MKNNQILIKTSFEQSKPIKAKLESNNPINASITSSQISGTTDYEKLINHPRYNDIVIIGNLTADDLNIQDKIIYGN